MTEIFGPSVPPFVLKLLAAADYKDLDYRRQEYVVIRELRTLNPGTGKVPVARIDGRSSSIPPWSPGDPMRANPRQNSQALPILRYTGCSTPG